MSQPPEPSSSQKKSWRESSTHATGDIPPEQRPATSNTRLLRTAGIEDRRSGRMWSGASDQSATPSWLPLFVAATSLLVVLALLGGVLAWVFLPPAAKPLLIPLAVTDYESPIFRANDYALADTLLIRKSPHLAQGNANLTEAVRNFQVERTFQTLFRNILPALKDETLLLYLSAHGVADENEAYLLTADADPSSSTRWFPISVVLQSLAECPAKNKILFLDATRQDALLEAGQLGNDFVHHLGLAVDRLGQKLKTENRSTNLWILCASDDGQQAWTIPALGHSVFGLACAYCLHGAADVDTTGPVGKPDQRISAEELVAYVQRQVNNWSIAHRGQPQQPRLFRLEEFRDFPLVDVSANLDPQTLLAPPDSKESDGDKAASEEKKPSEATASSADVAKGDASSSTEPVKKPDVATKKAPLRVSTLRQRLKQLWERRELARASSSGWVLADGAARRSTLALRRAERALIGARPLDEVNDALDSAEADLAKSSRSSAVATLPPIALGFSAIGDKDPQKPVADLVDGILQKPDKKSKAAVDESRDEVTDLLIVRTLSQSPAAFRESWEDGALVRTALALRRAADGRLASLPPELLPLLREPLEQAARHRREAERAIYLGQSAVARRALTDATAALEQATTDGLAQETRWASRVSLDAWDIVHWLAEDPFDREGHQADIQLLDRFLGELRGWALSSSPLVGQGQEGQEGPTRDGLTRDGLTRDGLARDGLARAGQAARTLDEQTSRTAETVRQARAWRRAWAALRLSNLPANQRDELVTLVLTLSNQPPWNDQGSSDPNEGSTGRWRARPANPYPLTQLLRAWPPSPEREQLLNELKPFEPLTEGGYTFDAVRKDPSVRRRRAALGQRLSEFLRRRESLAPQTAAPSLAIQLQEQLWRGLSGNEEDETQIATQRQHWLDFRGQWERQQLELDNQALPGAPLDGVLRILGAPALARSLKLINESIVFSEESSTQTNLVVETVSTMAGDQGATLHLDWFPWRRELTARSGTISSVDGRLTVPLKQVAVGGKVSIPVTWTRTGSPDRVPRIQAWAEWPRERLEWFSLSTERVPSTIPRAKLLVKAATGKLVNGPIRLYPGQRQSLRWEIATFPTTPAELRLELIDPREGRPFVWPIAIPPKAPASLELVPSSAIHLAFPSRKIDWRLFASGSNTILDRGTLEVSILDPLDFLKADISFDERKRELSLTVSLTTPSAGSDSLDPLPLTLDLPSFQKKDIKGGRIESVLDPSSPAPVTLTAIIAEGLRVEEFLATLSVGSYPRAFVWKVGRDRATGQRQTNLTLEIASPIDKTRYKSPSAGVELPVRLRIDGVIRDQPLTARVGFDESREGQLSPRSSLEKRLPEWRDARATLTAAAAKPEITIRADVDDVTFSLPLPGLVGRQRLLAEARREDAKKTASIDLFFLDDAPSLVVERPAENVSLPLEKPIEFVVRPESLDMAGAIDRVEIGRDLDGDDRFSSDDKERLQMMAWPRASKPNPSNDREPSSAKTSLKVSIDSKGWSTGQVRLMARARASVRTLTSADPKESELVGPTTLRTIQLYAPAVEKPSPKPTTGKIEGQVVRGSSGKSGVEVSGEPAIPGAKVMTDSAGKFVIDNVPPGNYVLKAAIPLQPLLGGQGTVFVKAGETAEITIELRVK